MDTTKTKVFFWILSIIFVSSVLFSAPHSSAKVYREPCGENATWEYNTKTKILKISGTGAVTETIAAGERKGAWGEGKPLRAKKIIISEGITALDCPNGLFGCVSSIAYDSTGKTDEKTKLQLPDSLESIGSLSFSNWFDDITIPQNVKDIAPAAIGISSDADASLSVASDNPYFCMLDGVLFSKNKKSLIYYPPNKTQKEYTVPRSVRKIAPLAFRWAGYLERVILPDGLKKLGSGAFYGCTSLEYVNLSDKMKIKSITDYDTSKFYDTPEAVGSWDFVDDNIFEGFYYLEKSLDSDHRYASETCAGTFEGTSIRSIHIPNSVKYLSSNTFFNDWNIHTYTTLQEISFGKDFSGEINMGDSQSGMKTLTLNGGYDLKISIPGSNKKYCVEDGILYSKDKSVLYFASNYEGKNLTLPKTVKKIANGAFANRNVRGKLQNVIIQGDLEYIGYNAFLGSTIKTFTCNGKINQMGEYAFANCNRLKMVKIKELKEIPEFAFVDCQSLKTINCGTKVEKIDSYAFDGCMSLTKVTVGKELRSMAESAFEGCTSLSPDAIPKTQQQQMEENLLAFRQLIGIAYEAYLRT